MKFLWNEFKYPHFKSCITNDDIALLVVASCEPHTLHLPVGTDKIIGKYISKRVAEKSKKNTYIYSLILNTDFQLTICLSKVRLH